MHYLMGRFRGHDSCSPHTRLIVCMLQADTCPVDIMEVDVGSEVPVAATSALPPAATNDGKKREAWCGAETPHVFL